MASTRCSRIERGAAVGDDGVMRETYVSIDIEADGPIPGPHSMLSLGAVAFDREGMELDAFSVNLQALEGAAGHPDTMAWWQTQPVAWAACREHPESPSTALPRFSAWLQALPGRAVCVGYPVAFDFMFVHWYLHRFTGGSPFSHSALDMKTLAWTLLGGHYRDATKRHMPRAWFPENVTHSHVAVQDAREQGLLFFGMWRALRGG
jgi:hypothetical protein